MAGVKFRLHGLEENSETVTNAEGDEGAPKGREGDNPRARRIESATGMSGHGLREGTRRDDQPQWLPIIKDTKPDVTLFLIGLAMGWKAATFEPRSQRLLHLFQLPNQIEFKRCNPPVGVASSVETSGDGFRFCAQKPRRYL
jgi:hypothetical protein